MTRAAPLLLAVVLALAGCAGASSPAGTASDPDAPPGFDDATGALTGRVLNDELLPLANATVTVVASGQSATTNTEGVYTLSGLAPGPHTVAALALGYEPQARTATVVAGELLTLNFDLVPTPIEEPRISLKTLVGKTTCTVSYRSSVNYLRPSCSAVVSTDKWNIQYDLAAGFQELLVETTWKPTYILGNQLFQIVRVQPFTTGSANIKESEGHSPIRIHVPHEDWVAWDQANSQKYSTDGGPLSLSTFAAHNLVPKPSPVELGLVLDQSFTVYSSASFHQRIPLTYTALPDQ